MNEAVAYLRVSTKEQAKSDRYSLDTQKRLCGELARSLNYQIVEFFVDARTGRNVEKRKEFLELLSYLEANKNITAVFVQDTDRLARNVRNHLYIKDKLKEIGVKVHSVSQPMLDDSPTGNLTDTMMAAINQFYSEQNAYKVTNALQQKVKDGWFPTHAPIGYLNVKDPSNKNIIATDKERMPYIVRAFDLFKTGNYTVLELQDVLFNEGFRNRTGQKIGKNAINTMLKNVIYLGKFVWHGEVHQGKHEAVIDQTTFDRVQQIILEHGGKDNRRRKHSFLLRGFLYCPCGRRITAEHHPKKNKSYYHCTSGKECKEPYIEIGEMEDAVSKLFKQVTFSPELQSVIMTKLKLLFEKRKKLIDQERQDCINKKTAAESKRNIAEQKLIEGVLSNDDFKRLRNLYASEIDHLNAELLRLDSERNFKIDDIGLVLELIQNIYQAYTKAPVGLKKRYLGLFWERIEVSNKQIINAQPTKLLSTIIQANCLVTKEPALKPVLTTYHQQGLLDKFRTLNWKLIKEDYQQLFYNTSYQTA